ncbi:MAG: lasso peptide biosynthesis B2 protein [Hyphomonadaceae bacterium]|nr:lasso peptide biosynthesis B2 protein [Hyphomonadaceae bacterium]
MTTYQLSPHVRACKDGRYIVLLDLRLDRYWSVPLRSAPDIVGLVETECAHGSGARLIELGLIEPVGPCRAPYGSRTAAPEQKLLPTEQSKASLFEYGLCASACWWTAGTLTRRRLDLTLARLADLKSRAVKPEADTQHLIGVFESFRPWFPRRRVCLFDALALFRFMVMRGLRPDLVFGVRTAPFAAHCWVEWQGWLAGDSSDHCASFTPIAWV